MVPAKKAERYNIKTRFKKTSQPTSFFMQKKYRLAAYIVLPLFGLIVIGQLLYPQDHGLPLARVGDTPVGMKTDTQIAKLVQDMFSETAIRLTVGSDKAVTANLKSAGAEPNTDKMVADVVDYPWWLRLIPGSVLLHAPSLQAADVYYTQDILKQFSDAKSKELTFPPVNARLEIKNGKLVASDAVSGSTVKSDELLRAISSATLRLGKTTSISAPAVRKTAQRTSGDLAKVRGEAEAALAHSVTIKADGKQFSPDKSELASWIVLSTDAAGNVSLAADKEKIKKYLDGINRQVGTPAGQTNIEIVDGREISRTTGASGRAIDSDKLAEQIAASLLVPPPAVTKTAEFVDVQPSVIFNSKYTTTQEGLQAYVSDVARSKNMWIEIQQLDGGKWHAAAREHESIPSGSTYKLFVAMVLFDKMAKGEIHWEDPMLDTTVAGCFERMTVASTNPCAEKWIADFGRQYINDFVHARGFSEGTSFTTGSANQTTADDLTRYMTGLNDGTLVSGGYRDRLLDSLGRHPYRYGIPTGSAGTVHDKVGFLWDYVHDTAIVQHPRGTYIMTIMTKGQSYAAIAAVTRQVERIMYP